jgi:hypothetical protein
MRESSSETCGIERLHATSIKTRLTSIKTLEKYKHLQEGIDQMNAKQIQDQSN